MRTVLILPFLSLVSAFNIDTKHPIIINNLADGPDSYFGASINILKEDSSDTSWIIIGSPRANSTNPLLRDVAEPGQVWRCSLGQRTESCEVVVVDPNNLVENGLKDRKDESWLGGSLHSRGKKFVSCASRWSNQYAYSKNDSYHYFMNGQCYWRPKADLTDRDIPETVPKNYRLHALRNKDSQSLGKDSFYWIFAQAGFSVHLSEHGDLIIGAPGMDQWRGGFVRYFDASNSAGYDVESTFRNYFVSKPELDNFDRENCTYFGFAVTSGNFFKKRGSDTRSVQYVGGGPRGNSLDGRVVIFQFPEEGGSAKLQLIQTIDGEQIGSYFGSVLCAVDVNSDGYDDLLIGAPNYNTKLRLRSMTGDTQEVDMTSSTFPGNGDEGSVFLYLSSGNSLMRAVSLVGGNKAWSHFGSSIASLGDINKDGYNDVAVGSPYEDDSRGAVYIFHGTRDGLDTEYAQVIRASVMDRTLRGFGYSLVSEVDVDKNGYNDISIGAFASNQVVLLRTRPVVQISAEVKTSMDRLPLNTTEFEIQSCISYNGFNVPPILGFGITVKTDSESILPRVHIKTNATASNSTLTYSVKVQHNRQLCTPFTGVVKTNLTVTTKPIVVEQEVFLMDERNEGVVVSRVHEIRRTGTVNSVQVRGAELDSFCESCPVRIKRKPFTSKLALEVPCAIEQCTSELALTASFIGVKEGGSFVIGSAPSVTLHVEIRNLRDPAFAPTVTISWRKRHLVRIPPNCQRHNMQEMNLMSYQCSLGQMLSTNEVATVELEIDMRGMYAGHPDTENECTFEIHSNTTSELVAPSKLAMILLLRAEADVWLAGSKLEINYNPTDDVQLPRKLAFFEVALSGYTSVGKMLLYFEIPVNLTSNANKLTLLQIASYKATLDRTTLQCKSDDNSLPSTEKSIAFDPSLDAEMIEPSLVHHQDRGNLRRKRDTEDLLSYKIVVNYGNRKKPDISNDRKVLSLDCSNAGVDCVRLHCVVENFNVGSNAVVEFSVTTNTETMKRLMKTHKAQSVHVHSYGTARIVGIDTQYIQPLGHKTDEAYAMTVIKPQTTEIPTWVYTVSVVGGLLVLGCLILCLYAVGFFERKKKEEVAEDLERTKDGRDDDDEEEYDEVDALRGRKGEDEVSDGNDDDDAGVEEDRSPSPLETEQYTENPNFDRR